MWVLSVDAFLFLSVRRGGIKKDIGSTNNSKKGLTWVKSYPTLSKKTESTFTLASGKFYFLENIAMSLLYWKWLIVR